MPKKTENKRKGNPNWQKGRSANPSKQFTSEQQPSPEAKKEGWDKTKKGKQLAQAILELAFKGMVGSDMKKNIAAYFGVEEADLTMEMVLHMRQIEKAIQKADTFAYNAVMARAFGLPKQTQEITGKDGKPLQTTQKVVKLILPKKKMGISNDGN